MAVEMTNAGGMLIITDWHCFQVQGEYNPANGIACGVILGLQLTERVGNPLATPITRGGGGGEGGPTLLESYIYYNIVRKLFCFLFFNLF